MNRFSSVKTNHYVATPFACTLKHPPWLHARSACTRNRISFIEANPFWRIEICLQVVCFILAFVFSAFAEPISLRAQERPFGRIDLFETTIQSQVVKEGVVGLAVAVIENGEIVWVKGFGYADREREEPVDPKATQFRWASISKSVTAVCALQLVEKGMLDLDRDIRDYVPEFPDKGIKITSRQLLCHQGGIVHYTNGPVIPTKRDYDSKHPFAEVITALDTFKDSPLVNPPGEKYSYSTHGYILLSAVVERAGKQRFADQVRERISKPLGMTSFRPDYHWEAIPNRAVGYLRILGVTSRRSSELDRDVSWKLGGGGFTSTVYDLATFAKGLLQTQLVSKKTEREMWTNQSPKEGKGVPSYGLGFSITNRANGKRYVGHSGSQEKTRTAMLFDPETKHGIAVMSNSEWFDAMKLANTLLQKMN